jgi:hypothetical protein
MAVSRAFGFGISTEFMIDFGLLIATISTIALSVVITGFEG